MWKKDGHVSTHDLGGGAELRCVELSTGGIYACFTFNDTPILTLSGYDLEAIKKQIETATDNWLTCRLAELRRHKPS